MKFYFLYAFLMVALGCCSQSKANHENNAWQLSTKQPLIGALYEYTIESGYLGGRKLSAYIPPHYFQSNKRFDVVYFHDGQMLFDSTTTWNHQSWELVEAMQKYLPNKNVIIIGIENHPIRRYAEFFPSPIYNKLPSWIQTTLCDSLWNGKPCFDSYANALISDVFPLVENTWRVFQGGKHRAMVGSSLGGVVSFTFLLSFPSEVQDIACLSMHLPLIDSWKFKDRFKEPLSHSFNAFVKTNGKTLSKKNIYIDRGDLSLDAIYASYFPAFELALQSLQKKNTVEVKLIENSGHSEDDWAKRIGPILNQLLQK